MIVNDSLIAVIGLGYVGLPLAVEFGKKRPTIGFDINPERVAQLNLGIDQTLEVSKAELILLIYRLLQMLTLSVRKDICCCCPCS